MMIHVFAFFLVQLLGFTVSQETSKLGPLKVSLTLQGRQFDVSFEATKDSVENMSNKLCYEQGGGLGFTQETVGVCISAVRNYLQNALDDWLESKLLEIPLSVSGNEFDLRFYPELTSADDMAAKVCSDYQNEIGVNGETIRTCIEPVSVYLQGAVNRWVKERSVSFPITVGGYEFQMDFIADKQTPGEMAAKLCSENAEILGVKKETFNDCLVPVSQFIQGKLDDWVKSKSLTVELQVNGKDYNLRFMPERESTLKMGRKLCIEKQAELGLTTENLISSCINPVAEYLQVKVNEWLAEKTFSVDIDLGGRALTLSFMPERKKAIDVAREICFENAAVLNLNNETVFPNCVSPVKDFLQPRVDQWYAMKSQSA